MPKQLYNTGNSTAVQADGRLNYSIDEEFWRYWLDWICY